MKTLYLLRHCEALPGASDFERSLSEKGHAKAEMLGRTMKEKNYSPAMALCSAARRTSQTLEGILKTIGINTVEYERRIYEQGRDEILAMIRALDDKFESALIVGHNPSMHALAVALADENSSPQSLMDHVTAEYSPGTLCVLTSPGSWSALASQKCRIADLLT